MGLSTSREALAAARIVQRSKLTNGKAIANLSQFALEMGLFNHADSDNHGDYLKRVRAEREACDTSDVSRESADTGASPTRIINDRRKAVMDKLAEKARHTLRLTPATKVHYVTDPTSIDYRDPEDFYRTPLIKAAIDGDNKRIEDLVEQGADLYVCDIEGNNAVQNAMNFGNDEIVFYLRRAMNERPERASGIKTA